MVWVNDRCIRLSSGKVRCFKTPEKAKNWERVARAYKHGWRPHNEDVQHDARALIEAVLGGYRPDDIVSAVIYDLDEGRFSDIADYIQAYRKQSSKVPLGKGKLKLMGKTAAHVMGYTKRMPAESRASHLGRIVKRAVFGKRPWVNRVVRYSKGGEVLGYAPRELSRREIERQKKAGRITVWDPKSKTLKARKIKSSKPLNQNPPQNPSQTPPHTPPQTPPPPPKRPQQRTKPKRRTGDEVVNDLFRKHGVPLPKTKPATA